MARPTIIDIKLTVNDRNEILFNFVDPDLAALFNSLDAQTFFKHVRPRQLEAQKNTKDRKEKKKDLDPGKIVSADDYPGEPPTPHPGIHLRFNGEDQIRWFSEQQFNFVIDIGPDPELYRLPRKLEGSNELLMKDLQCERHFIESGGTDSGPNNPFANKFPLILENGEAVLSGPLLTGLAGPDPVVKAQRFYKYTVTVMGTPIVLDPHIEGHDD